jgi:hypothetical protein
MKKVFSSFLLIALVIASVSLSAYALFSSTANVSGLTFSTGSADLQISTDGSSWSNSVSLPSLYENMAPGFTSSQSIYLKNVSLSNINLDVFTRLVDSSPTANEAAWDIIGHKIIVSFQKLVDSTWTDIALGSLSQWKDTGFTLDSLAVNSPQNYRMLVSLSGIENADASQVLSDLSFNFVGTQQ